MTFVERRTEVEARLDDDGKRSLRRILGNIRSDLCAYNLARHRDTYELLFFGFTEDQIQEYIEAIAWTRKV